MAPIRVGIIGLSKGAKTSWASSAHLPYLIASNGKYKITALCNSSKESAQAAIEEYDLGSSTKAYGTPEELAADPDVDLVVCNTRVDIHHPTTKPSIQAGKDVFVEWPLASTLADAAELESLARQKGVRTMIGLQTRLSPHVATLRRLLDSGRIGAVLSSTAHARGGTSARDALPHGLRYFADRAVGGNVVTIGFAHHVDYVHTVLGEFSSLEARNAILRPELGIVDADGAVVEKVKSDVPDHVVVHGNLAQHGDAPLTLVFQRSPPFPGTPGLVWQIAGSKGEIRVVGPGPALQFAGPETEIWLQDYEKDAVEKVEWEYEFAHLPQPARDVASMYEAFAAGGAGTGGVPYPDFGEAVKRHREIGVVFQSSDTGKRAGY